MANCHGYPHFRAQKEEYLDLRTSNILFFTNARKYKTCVDAPSAVAYLYSPAHRAMHVCVKRGISDFMSPQTKKNNI